MSIKTPLPTKSGFGDLFISRKSGESVKVGATIVTLLYMNAAADVVEVRVDGNHYKVKLDEEIPLPGGVGTVRMTIGRNRKRLLKFHVLRSVAVNRVET